MCSVLLVLLLFAGRYRSAWQLRVLSSIFCLVMHLSLLLKFLKTVLKEWGRGEPVNKHFMAFVLGTFCTVQWSGLVAVHDRCPTSQTYRYLYSFAMPLAVLCIVRSSRYDGVLVYNTHLTVSHQIAWQALWYAIECLHHEWNTIVSVFFSLLCVLDVLQHTSGTPLHQAQNLCL